MLKPFSDQANTITKGAVYKHYKGSQYKVLAVGRHSETLEEMVIYESLYGDHDIWVRPLSLFLENVTIEGTSQPRFKPVK